MGARQRGVARVRAWAAVWPQSLSFRSKAMETGHKKVDELCREQKIGVKELAEKAELDEQRVMAIVLGRWTPSPAERDRVAAAFGLTREQIAWGHKTPIQHIYGSGPA